MKQLFTFLTLCLLLASCKSESDQKEESLNQTANNEKAADSIAIDIQPISHATAAINWGGSTFYLDPTGGAAAFEGMEKPDFVLITDIHGDHLDPKTLAELELGEIPLIVPQAVKEQLPDSLQQYAKVMNNGETLEESGFSIEAIPMYNLREEAKQYHPKGRGNGYVLEKDGQRLYIAGDTGDIQEMRKLKNIDVALIPMNLPYTMPVERAADAVLEFEPEVVYPYHFRGTDGFADVEKFKTIIRAGNPEIEVKLAEWYPNRNSQE